MAGFHTKTFLQHDSYMTPKYAWSNIKHLIPSDKIIWEAFWGDGKSGLYLEELGFNVIHDEDDFFESNKGDIVVSNPPFTKVKEILQRLVEMDKPFILILPSSKINTQYVRNIFKDQGDKLQIVIPRKRIQFIKNGDELQNKCNFDCFYYCWKMNLERDIIWLD
jgi:hypothetical protein